MLPVRWWDLSDIFHDACVIMRFWMFAMVLVYMVLRTVPGNRLVRWRVEHTEVHVVGEKRESQVYVATREAKDLSSKVLRGDHATI